ncbi:PEGA domain-containing protein [Sorangium sp. So ce233]|uniref:PEGA domain-containing protein n=1 Tax=Sorangium sp. So ce233 TaxID=3133290 RepID=UPI003F648983
MRIPRALALCAAIALVPRGALAEPADRTAEADARFRRGVELYGEADYIAALTEFRRAYALAPAYQVLYNIAGACYQLRDYGGARIAGDRRAEVERDIAVLRGRVATVALSTSAPGVEISVDDVPVGKTPLAEPLLLSAGRRRIVVEAPDRPAVVRVIDVAGGDHVQLRIDLPEARALRDEGAGSPVASSSAQPGAPVERAPRAARSAPVLPWIATGTLAAGAAVTGIIALGASADLQAALDAFPGDARAIDRERKRTATLALTADLLAGAAVVAGGVSLVLTVVGGGPERGDGARAPSPSVRLVCTPSSLQLVGSF